MHLRNFHGLHNLLQDSHLRVFLWSTDQCFSFTSLQHSFIQVSIFANSPFYSFLLLYWCYDPVWVLASSTGPAPLFSILIHQGFWDLSLHYPATLGWVFQPSLPSGLEKISFLYGDVSFALVRCPSHLSLPSLTVFTISGALYKSYSS
jgi:hypothetical protein